MLRRIVGLIRDLTRGGKANLGKRWLGGRGEESLPGCGRFQWLSASASTSFFKKLLFVGWLGHPSNMRNDGPTILRRSAHSNIRGTSLSHWSEVRGFQL